MTRIKVHAGSCGFISAIEIRQDSNGTFTVRIESDCEMVEKLAEDLNGLTLKEVFTKDSSVYKKAFQCLRHISCPVPVGILKALEVEAGLNVPKAVRIEFE